MSDTLVIINGMEVKMPKLHQDFANKVDYASESKAEKLERYLVQGTNTGKTASQFFQGLLQEAMNPLTEDQISLIEEMRGQVRNNNCNCYLPKFISDKLWYSEQLQVAKESKNKFVFENIFSLPITSDKWKVKS